MHNSPKSKKQGGCNAFKTTRNPAFSLYLENDIMYLLQHLTTKSTLCIHMLIIPDPWPLDPLTPDRGQSDVLENYQFQPVDLSIPSFFSRSFLIETKAHLEFDVTLDRQKWSHRHRRRRHHLKGTLQMSLSALPQGSLSLVNMWQKHSLPVKWYQ